MKNLTNFIQEKYLINNDTYIYTCNPKDKFELRKILEERLKKDRNANLNDIDVSQITDMGYDGFPSNTGLFEDLDPRNIKIDQWDVSNVTDTRGMFYKCANFTGKGLENWTLSNVTNTRCMFEGCVKLKCNLENWNLDKTSVEMDWMFFKCDSLINTPTWYKGW